MNTELVRNVFRENEFATKNSLARDSGLSVATCGNILKDLIRSGEIHEIQRADSTGGRPSKQYVYNEDFAHAAVIYLRQEGALRTIFSAVINISGSILHKKTITCDYGTLDAIESVLVELTELYPRIKVISIGIPAVVNRGVIGICDFPGLSNINIEERLTQTFGIPVVAENDVNATALGYYRRNTGAGAEGFAYVYYPRNGNAGAGIIVHGKILKGFSHFAGEVSYLPLSVKYADQGKLQDDSAVFADFAARTILTINAVINPECVVLSGHPFSGIVQKHISQTLQMGAPEGHVPRLEFEPDIHDSYLEGLSFLALKKLSFQYEIVRK